MANKYNVHTQFYTNKKVVPGPEGILTGKNHNIQRGGGYGFNAKGTPGFGVMPIKTYSNCGTGKTPPVSHATGAIGTQHAGSPPPQRGGGKGACGCGGTPYYSFTAAGASALAKAGVNNYAPITPECHPMCGGRRRTRRRKGGRKRRKKHKSRRRRRKKRKSRRRRNRRRTRRRAQRGGYAQWASDVPSTPGYATPNGGNWQTANPPTYARNDACGTGNCVDNYNHYTGKGSPAPVLDADVSPTPKSPTIKTPNTKAMCGGRRRRSRRRRKSRRRRHRRRSRRRRRR